ncbi:MAG TPA: hypothetical protein VKU00_04200 [Chthonomonadaceae bacterium]|nr:hypothetical protein [Chthonomonadaceae bacterium]
MRQVLATETLKTGERMEIERVTPPDAERAAQILPFLAHKPPNYRGHIDRAFAGETDDLETHFYIGLIGDEMVGNIMTVETNGVGVFGHVHTRSDQRRKGICSAIMRRQMEDFRQRNGRVLLLGTGYQSAPYYIYASYGFQDWKPHVPGRMRYDNPADPEFEARFFAPAEYQVAPARWKHWPLVALLAAIPGPAYFRSFTFDLWGVGLMEGPYSKFLHENGARPEVSALVLESATGAVAAIATAIPDPRTHGDVRLLDIFAHPGVGAAYLAGLLHALPSVPMQSYADPNDAAKIGALENAGFRRGAVLPHQFREGDAWRDLWLYAR